MGGVGIGVVRWAAGALVLWRVVVSGYSRAREFNNLIKCCFCLRGHVRLD